MVSSLRLLMIEDSALDADILCKFLNYNDIDTSAERVESADVLTATLPKSEWDVILCDYHIHPTFTCQDALAIVQQFNAARQHRGVYPIPVIVVSSVINESKIVELMKQGASDFVIKGYFDRLLPVLERELSHVARARAYERIINELQSVKIP